MRHFISILVLSFLIIGCGQKDVSKIVVDPGFSSYVNAFSSGVISNQSTIKVVLLEPNANANPGNPITDELFQFSPEIEGQAYWVDAQTIEFRPFNNLPSGESFVVNFELGKLIEVPSKFKMLEFGFIVINQSLFVSFEGLSTTDIDKPEVQELFGTLRTSDVADPSKIESCLKASQDAKDLDIKWEHTKGSKTHKFTVVGVTRGEEESFVNLVWNGENIGSESEDQKEIRIPPLGEFTLVQINTVRKPGLYFSIQFSDPVDPKQDLTGLVHLKSGKKLRLEVNKNEIKAYPIQNLSSVEIIQVENTIRNTSGNQLQSSYDRQVQFNLERPAVELLGKGVIMPTDGQLRFPFKAINLKAVNVRILRIYENNVNQFFQENNYNGSRELTRVGRIVYDDVIDLVSDEALDYGVWNNFSLDINSLMEPEAGAIYRVMISYEMYQSLYPCADSTKQVKPFKRRKLNFDDGNGYFNDNNWYQGGYDYSERNNPCSPSYYKYYDRGISANIFSSNFGIIAKEGADNNYNVIITDLRNTESLSGIDVEAFNYQNQIIGMGSTNSDGVLNLKTDGKPYLLVAKKGNQRGYLRVDNGSALSVSLYDVGGSSIKKGVKGFIYGERGVWRPGDTLFLSFMLEDKQNTIPENHPIIMELYDPMGKLYEKRVKSSGVKGLYSFKFKTKQEDKTGNWRVKAIVGNSEFGKSLKIETIKPNRIKIGFDFPEVIKSDKLIASTLNAKWLYGSPGAGLKAKVEMEVSNMKTVFKGYDNYQFDDRSKSFYFNDPILAEGKTNAEGDVKLQFPWKKPSSAPGMLKMTFRTKVFEQGGDFSQDFLNRKYSPYNSYVGLKMDGGTNWRTALDSENEHGVSLACLSDDGKPITRTVKVEVYKMSWNWWWESSGSSEITRYINRNSSDLISSSNYTVDNGKGVFNLTFPKPTWGRYLILVRDTKSGHSASQIFYTSYKNWYNDGSGAGTEAASMLNLETDKSEYNVGEKVNVTIPSGGIGKAYITVEKGDKILDQFWVDAESGSTQFSIEATSEMAPNVYVNAVLIQPHGQTENSLPIRMYGVIPVLINDPNTRLNPKINCPDVLQPEKTFEVKVSEKDGKKMAYSLAVVDEGLLSLTRFKTPNPWGTFYSKEALKIRTWDMYKYVMNAQTGKMNSLLAIGGDQGLIFKEDAKANRFKPVVSYLGPFFLDAGDVNKHSVHIPNYIGAVRVMVVAGYEGAYGSGEKEIQVKKPLMVLSTLPRVLGPSEKIKVPINVITMSDNLKNVKVKVESNDLLKCIGSTQQTVSFTKAAEKTTYFEFDVARKLGVAKFKVTVSSGKENAYEEVELLVRPANPEITSSTLKSINPAEVWDYGYKAMGIKGTNKITLQVSKLPDLNLEKHLGYLIRYPHGCIEQTTSGVFPQLFLNSLIPLRDDQKEEIEKNVIAGLNRLQSFQVVSGAFTYWPGHHTYISEWGTNYAGHFMIEAKNKGYDLPPGMLQSWLKFQKERATSWDRNRYNEYGRYGGDLTQAYRLYTLALSDNAEVGAMNRLRIDNNLSDAAAWRLAAAYAIMGRDDVAKGLCNRTYSVSPYRDMGYSYGSHVRDLAMILETMSYTKDMENGTALLNNIAKELNIGWHSTQTRAYSLLAISKFIGGNDASANFAFEATVNGEKRSIDTDQPIYQIEVDKDHLESGNVVVKNKNDQAIFASIASSGIPVEMNDPASRKNMTMRVTYQDLKGNPLTVTRLDQGTDFKAIVTIGHTGPRGQYKEVALSQLFPSGWQIINTRVGESTPTAANYVYRDIRDDRVLTYFNLGRGKSKTFEVLLNATFVGKFYKPAIFCAPMYDESIQALDPGEWVEVVNPAE